MHLSIVNGKKIYNLSAGKAIPDWLSDRKRRQLLKKNQHLAKRTELIQDLEMPVLSTDISLSPDGNYLFVAGMYKPRIRCYDFKQMAMKFERCFDSECIKLMVLSEDYTKLAMLQQDRHIEFHHGSGFYFKIRIPKIARDFCYDPHTCTIFSCGASCDIFRLNLDHGQFEDSFTSDKNGFNCCDINSNMGLLFFGSVDGTIDCWDMRVSNTECIRSFDCSIYSPYRTDADVEVPAITSIKFKDNLNIGVGTSTGQVLLFDIRSDKPYTTKDHYYGLPIKKLSFHTSIEHDLVLSLDEKVLKIWDRNNGDTFTAIQPEQDLNSFCAVPDTGLIFTTGEGQKIQPYFIPELGQAPNWCSYLEQITDEVEKSVEDNVIYDDYKFVTLQDLEQLGMEHLIGTNLLRGYMHGFFIDINLYNKARATSNPYTLEKLNQDKVEQKLANEKRDRTQLLDILPQVNRKLAAKLLMKKQQANEGNSEVKTLLDDPRFNAMFENPDFDVKK